MITILSKVTAPKTKAELILAIQRSRFRSFSVYETLETAKLPSIQQLVKDSATVIILKP